MSEVAVNARTLAAPLTGVQRYVTELLKEIGGNLHPIAPRKARLGLSGHAWEQCALPRRLGGRLLWSPANTGPLSVARQVVTIHDLSVFDRPDSYSFRFRCWYRWLLPRLARRASRVIVTTRFVRSRLESLLGVPSQRIHVVPLGVSDRFLGVRKSSLPLVHPKRYVLSLGSLEPRKNIPNLLAAWARILPEIDPDIDLLIAGETGTNRIFEDARFQLPPRTRLLGRVADEALPSLLTHAELFVFPSLYEGFGLPPLEAMACGTPVMASDHPALAEHLSGAAHLVDANSVEAIAAGMRLLILSGRAREHLAESGRQRSKEYTWRRCASATFDILRAAASEPAPEAHGGLERNCQ